MILNRKCQKEEASTDAMYIFSTLDSGRDDVDKKRR